MLLADDEDDDRTHPGVSKTISTRLDRLSLDAVARGQPATTDQRDQRQPPDLPPRRQALEDDDDDDTDVKPESASSVVYRTYRDEDDIPTIVDLIAPYLSEPYSIYCYRYFLHGWPELCIFAHSHSKDDDDRDAQGQGCGHAQQQRPVGVIVCKLDQHRGKLMRGYIAMLATDPQFRGLGIASTLVKKAIDRMIQNGAQEIVLETEVSNEAALRLYERLGFMRLKRLYRFYLNASDAFRLCLPIPPSQWQRQRLHPPSSSSVNHKHEAQDDTAKTATPGDGFLSDLEDNANEGQLARHAAFHADDDDVTYDHSLYT